MGQYYDEQYAPSFGTRALATAQQQQIAQQVRNIKEFNRNPRQFSAAQKAAIVEFAQQAGLNVSQGIKRDKATFGEHLIAGIGGVADSMLFGILKDSWYSDYRTKGSANIGKLAGVAASFAIPGLGILSSARGGKAALSAGKAAYGATKGSLAASSAAAAKAAAKAAKAAKTAKAASAANAFSSAFATGKAASSAAYQAAKAALGATNMSKSQVIMELAKVAYRGQQGAGAASAIADPNRYGPIAPYQEIGISGMPQMQ